MRDEGVVRSVVSGVFVVRAFVRRGAYLAEDSRVRAECSAKQHRAAAMDSTQDGQVGERPPDSHGIQAYATGVRAGGGSCPPAPGRASGDNGGTSEPAPDNQPHNPTARGCLQELSLAATLESAVNADVEDSGSATVLSSPGRTRKHADRGRKNTRDVFMHASTISCIPRGLFLRSPFSFSSCCPDLAPYWQ